MGVNSIGISVLNPDEIQALVSAAFKDVARPEIFTSGCGCDECANVNASLQSFESKTLPSGLAWELSLLSPAAIRYLTPALVRSCLFDSEDDELGCSFLAMLGTPISRTSPPDFLPFACEFNHQQFAAILEFLKFIQAHWYTESEPPSRDVERGLRNWKHFTERAARRTS